MQNWRAGLQRVLGIDHRRQRFVFDLDKIERVLGQVTVARDHHRHRLAHEARLVGREAVIFDRRLHADRERLRVREHVGAGYHASHSRRAQRGRSIDRPDARVRVGAPQNRRGVWFLERQVGNKHAAPGQQARIFDTLKRLSDPLCHRCPVSAWFRPVSKSHPTVDALPSAPGLRYVDRTIFVNETARRPRTTPRRRGTHGFTTDSTDDS